MILRTGAVAMLTASTVLLAGCASTAGIPPGISGTEAEVLVDAQLDSLWAGLRLPEGTVQPEVERIAWTTTDTWSSTQVGCLLGEGIAAREVSGGFAIDGADTPATAISQWTCLARYPVDPRGVGYLSDAQVLYMYDYFAKRLAPCLRLLGYAVDEPPPRADYLASVREGRFWSPYSEAIGDSADRQRIDARCPPLPADPYAAYLSDGWILTATGSR